MPLSAVAQPGQELKAGDVLGAAVAAALVDALNKLLMKWQRGPSAQSMAS